MDNVCLNCTHYEPNNNIDGTPTGEGLCWCIDGPLRFQLVREGDTCRMWRRSENETL